MIIVEVGGHHPALSPPARRGRPWPAARCRPGRHDRPAGRGRRRPRSPRRRATPPAKGSPAASPRASPATRASPAPVGLPWSSAAGRAAQQPSAATRRTPAAPRDTTTARAPAARRTSAPWAHVCLCGGGAQLVGVGLDDVGRGGTRGEQCGALGVDDGAGAAGGSAPGEVGIRVGRSAGRKAPGQHDHARPVGQLGHPGAQRPPLGSTQRRPALVERSRDSRVIDHGDGAARGSADRYEVVRHPARLEVGGQLCATAPARQRARQHRLAEPGQHARDVDPLAAGLVVHRANPVRRAGNEVCDAVRDVHRGVGSDGEDHGRSPHGRTRSSRRGAPSTSAARAAVLISAGVCQRVAPPVPAQPSTTVTVPGGSAGRSVSVPGGSAGRSVSVHRQNVPDDRGSARAFVRRITRRPTSSASPATSGRRIPVAPTTTIPPVRRTSAGSAPARRAVRR